MFTSKMQRLPVTDEAKVFYLSNCLRDADFVDVQLQDRVDLYCTPFVKLGLS